MALRDVGFHCVTLRDLGRAEARNGQVLALAAKRRNVLLTRDADFTDLACYPLGHHHGIIYLRITPHTMADVHRMLIVALRKIPPTTLRGALLIVKADAYRLRRPLR